MRIMVFMASHPCQHTLPIIAAVEWLIVLVTLHGNLFESVPTKYEIMDNNEFRIIPLNGEGVWVQVLFFFLLQRNTSHHVVQ